MQDVLLGQYDPADYAAAAPITDHWRILCELEDRTSPDTLKARLVRMQDFVNRNSYSDTVSNTTGIGAARRWGHDLFEQFDAENEDRLLTGYLRFDVEDPDSFACGNAYGWRNALAVLPGSDTTAKGIVIVEAHLDSRCAENCDGDCLAAGMEDNGSGSALVLELARVLSRYTFRRTIVFMLTTGEEQGLLGADAMASWCEANGVEVFGVQNNDIVGGVLCGETSSPPSCPSEGEVDSLQVRLFTNGNYQATYRGFARTIKTWYIEKMQDLVDVPMAISVMNQEDRTGRGGDHIPFRAKGYRNVRFTSANESGDANVEDTAYHDRQHTSDDILGVDTDGDLVIDSFFVDFNYLKRNTVINGMGLTLLAKGLEPPDFTLHDEPAGLRVSFPPVNGAIEYRIGVRYTSGALDFDAIHRTTDTSFTIPNLLAGTFYFVSMASLDGDHIMGPFSREYLKGCDANTPTGAMDPLPYHIDCAAIGITEQTPLPRQVSMHCEPDPFIARTRIVIDHLPRSSMVGYRLRVSRANGATVRELPLVLSGERGVLDYEHTAGPGVFICTLWSGATIIASTRMVVVGE